MRVCEEHVTLVLVGHREVGDDRDFERKPVACVLRMPRGDTVVTDADRIGVLELFVDRRELRVAREQILEELETSGELRLGFGTVLDEVGLVERVQEGPSHRGSLLRRIGDRGGMGGPHRDEARDHRDQGEDKAGRALQRTSGLSAVCSVRDSPPARSILPGGEQGSTRP